MGVVVKIMTSTRSRHLTNLTDHRGFRCDFIQLILSDHRLTWWLQQLRTWWTIIVDLSRYPRQSVRSLKITYQSTNCSWGVTGNYDRGMIH